MDDERPEFLQVLDKYAAYRPVSEVQYDDAVDLIDAVIEYCRQKGIGKLFVDITQLTGFPPPSTVERFSFAKKWAETAGGALVMSMLAPTEMIDPDRIGITMAGNRGLVSNVSDNESEAIKWLLAQSYR